MSARNVGAKRKLKPRKRRRFRPYKNAKKFLARLGVARPYARPYAPVAPAASAGADIQRTLSGRSERNDDDDDDDRFM